MHATFTRCDPHPPALAVWNDADDPASWHIDTSDGDNVLDLPVETTTADIDNALASLGCHRRGRGWQQSSHMWCTAIEPIETAD